MFNEEVQSIMTKNNKEKSKLGKLVGTAVGFASAGPALFSAFGWAAIIVCSTISALLIIKIVKLVRKK